MNFKCFTKGHDYEKIREQWINNAHDEYFATNFGGLIKSYQHDVYRCKRCLKEKFVHNGEEKFIR